MISDPSALNELRQSWNGVRQLRNKVQKGLLGSFGQGASSAIFLADIAHNLPFLHAYAVLQDVLRQLRKERKFECESGFLGPLMDASQGQLPWNDFPLVKDSKDNRNLLAHDGVIIPRADCWKYIDAIERELVSWKIVDPAQ